MRPRMQPERREPGEDSLATGGTATRWIELPVLTPPVRQSTVEDYILCPRKFMLRHRFGLSLPGYDEALTIGTFYHNFMAFHRLGRPEEEAVLFIERAIDRRMAEALERAGPIGILPGGMTTDQLRKKLEQWADVARAMASVFQKEYPWPSRFKTLLVEQEILMDHAEVPGKMVGTIDALVADEDRRELWLVDDKTCSNPKDRVATIPFEVQPFFYLCLVSSLLDIRQEFEGYQVRGIIHNVIERPAIRISGADRDFKVTKRVLKSGPRKGQEVEEKEYEGEPKFSNYVNRVRDWYTGSGDYAYEERDRKTEPLMLQSEYYFPAGGYEETLTMIYKTAVASRCRVDLDSFYRCAGACRSYGSMCEFIDLCSQHPSLWGPVLKRFVTNKRNDPKV